MGENKTVIIVGAGASHEVGLPTGQALLDDIQGKVNLIDGNPSCQVVLNSLKFLCDSCPDEYSDKFLLNDFCDAGKRMCLALPNSKSIDNFLDTNRGDYCVELCGKLAIVEAILLSERKSALYFDPIGKNPWIGFGNDKVRKSWFLKFMHELTENCTLGQLPDRLKKISFIVFNYDRCIEHYLFNAFQSTYSGVGPVEAAELMCYLSIVHPYGTVGDLEWYGDGLKVKFGEEVEPERLLELTSSIKTFTESRDETTEDLNLMRKALQESTLVLWLGFAFHPLNLKLLQFEDNGYHSGRGNHYATAYGLSDDDIDGVYDNLETLTGVKRPRVKVVKDLECGGLFIQYGRRLKFN